MSIILEQEREELMELGEAGPSSSRQVWRHLGQYAPRMWGWTAVDRGQAVILLSSGGRVDDRQVGIAVFVLQCPEIARRRVHLQAIVVARYSEGVEQGIAVAAELRDGAGAAAHLAAHVAVADEDVAVINGQGVRAGEAARCAAELGDGVACRADRAGLGVGGERNKGQAGGGQKGGGQPWRSAVGRDLHGVPLFRSLAGRILTVYCANIITEVC